MCENRDGWLAAWILCGFMLICSSHSVASPFNSFVTPHMRLCCRYAMTYSWAPWVIKVWAPLVGTVMAVLVAAMECRMMYGFTTGR